jgi:photosystem II stability/assembly factor-like uncharacterized protein
MVIQLPPGPPDSEVEDGVIEEARERQLRHRQAGVAVISAALAIGAILINASAGGGGTGAAGRNHGRSPSASPATHPSPRAAQLPTQLPEGWSTFGVLAPRVGWTVGWTGRRESVDLTRNGGRSWTQLALKPIMPATSMHLYGSSPAGVGRVVLSFTYGGQVRPTCASGDAPDAPGSDESGGRGEVVFVTNFGRASASRAFAPCEAPGSISFLNGGTGFAVGYRSAVHRDPIPSLYKTTDQGRSWAHVARLPFSGEISFAGTRYGLGGGWAQGGGLVDGGAIYRTADGGRSWTRTPLCRSAAGSACEQPYLFRSGRGVVLVTTQNGQTNSIQVDVYTTRNNGRSWSRHVLPDPPPQTNEPYIPFSAANANDLFAWISPYLYRSTDGGSNWSRARDPELTPRGAQPSLSGPISFANSSYGWYAYIGQFEYTADAGRHWTRFGS